MVNIILKYSDGVTPDCDKGHPCGEACIARNKKCLENVSEETKATLEKFVANIMATATKETKDTLAKNLSAVKLSDKQVKALEDIGRKYKEGEYGDQQVEEAMRIFTDIIIKPKSDKGSAKTFSYEDLEHSQAVVEEMKLHYNKSFDANGELAPKQPGGVAEFVDKFRKVEIPDSLVEEIYTALPTNAKSSLNNLGDPKGRFGAAWAGVDDEGNPKHGAPSAIRGKMLLKRYMEQSGVDPYTGKRMPFKDMEPEHTVPMEVGGLKADDERNLLMASAPFNRYKDKLSGDELSARIASDLEAGKESWDAKNAKKEAGAKANSAKRNAGGDEWGNIMNKVSKKERIEYIKQLSDKVGEKNLKYALRASPLGVSTFPENKPFDSVSNDRGGRPGEIGARMKSPVQSSILIAYASISEEDVPKFTEALKALFKERGISKDVRAELENKYTKGSPEAKQASKELLEAKDKAFEDGLEKLLRQFGVV